MVSEAARREERHVRMWAQAVRVSVWLWGLPFRLRRYPLPLLLARLTPTGTPPSSDSTPDMQRLVRLVVRVCHVRLFRPPLFPRACLRQSLALYYVLARLGYPVAIHFGVRKATHGLQGHSWVSVQGIPVAERTPLEVFRVVYAYPPAPSCVAPTGQAGCRTDEA